MKTGLVCEDPKHSGEEECLRVKNSVNDNLQLLEIKNKIESFDTRFCKSATHIKDLYNGVKMEDIPMTILAYLKRV